MASPYQVMCINKREHQNLHERIRAIGGVDNGRRWKLTEEEAISRVLANPYEFFVSVNGKTAWVMVATHLGRRYLKTEPDAYAPNNLLALPECP